MASQSLPTPRPTGVVPRRAGLVTLGHSILGVTAVLAVEAVSPGWSIVVPAFLILSYVGLTLRNEKTAEGVSAAADHVYFLGYLCMIAALCSLGLQVWRDPKALDDPSTVAL